jgi:hypothetical protein
MKKVMSSLYSNCTIAVKTGYSDDFLNYSGACIVLSMISVQAQLRGSPRFAKNSGPSREPNIRALF